jgi:sugar phosphate isomerase/epimerase
MQRALSTHLIVNHRLTTVWLEKIFDAGFPLVEIFCARQHFDYRDRAQVAELGYWFRDAELRCHSLHSPMYNDDCWGRTGPGAVVSITELSRPKRLAAVDEIKRALDVAEKFPFRYLVQHLGVSGEEYDEKKLEAAFTALEEICLFAKHRGVEVLLENIPNRLSSAERLLHFNEATHLNLNFCFDSGHAHLMEGVENAFRLMKDRIRSTHIHDNDGERDIHLFPTLAAGGTIDWKSVMPLLREGEDRFPLLLELKESPEFPNPVESAARVAANLESL